MGRRVSAFAIMDDNDFRAIVELFQSEQTLPRLPEPAIHLIDLIDQGDPSCQDLEMVIFGDPPLAAAILRAASSAAYAVQSPTTTVNAAILRLGLRSVRALGLTFAMQAMLGRSTDSTYYDPTRFARHSVFVAICSQYLYVKATKEDGLPSIWSPDEVFGVGLLHDLSACLLAQVAPELYDRNWKVAKGKKVSIGTQFLKTFEEPMSVLGSAAVCAWRLPDIFSFAMGCMTKAPTDPAGALCHDVLVYADYLSVVAGFAHEPWLIVPDQVKITSPLQIDEEDQQAVFDAIGSHCDDFLAAAYGCHH